MRTETEIRKRVDVLYASLDAARKQYDAVLTWLNSPYGFEQDWDAAYTKHLISLHSQIKALEGGIYELMLALSEDERVAEAGEVWDKQQQKKNVDSLLRVPAGLIDETKRAELIARAKGSEDVQAYPSPTGGIWNVWDGNQRIELRGRCPSKFESQFEGSLHLYRVGGITLQEFEARVLSALQSAHVAPSPTSPPAENVTAPPT